MKKTYNITIMGEFPKVEKVAVPGSDVSYISAHKYLCFVHRDHRYYEPVKNSNAKESHYYATWYVSEQSTGASITTGRTRTEAIANAKSKIEQVGAEGMEIAIKTYADRIKSYNLITN